MKKNYATFIFLLLMVISASCSEKAADSSQVIEPTEQAGLVTPDSLVDSLVSVTDGRGLSHADSSKTKDLYSDTDKLGRPAKSKIINPTVPLGKLFHAWVGDINDPHAAFDLTREGLYLVDYDGDGNMPYILKGDSLIVYYEDEVQRSRIEKLTDDSLILAMDGYKVAYVRWRN